MKKKNQLVWLLSLVVLGMTQCRHETTEAYHEAGYQRDIATAPGEIYGNPTIEDDFDGSSVLVVMDKKTGGINKPHKMSFFGSFEMEYIKDLTEITGDIDSKEYLNKKQFHQILMIKLPKDSKENVLDVIRQLEKVEGILYANPNYYLYPAATPNDTNYTLNDQWALNTTYGIKAPEAWDITTGARGLLVGIIDTGVGPHPDLNANLQPGWNFRNNNSNTNETGIGHGTQVAGIVGAVGNNNIGIAGVCWDVSLVPLVISIDTDGYQALIDKAVSAITFATNHNIGILNFSQYSEYPSQLLLTALQNNYTGLFVCAAGNDNIDMNSSTFRAKDFYYNLSQLDNVIIVGAIKSNGNRWVDYYYPSLASNYGNNTVHLFAPGGAIMTTFPKGIYLNSSGTSFATPHVTGAAALLKSVNPFFSALQIKNAILNNVTPNSNLASYCRTGGHLNVKAALNSLDIAGYMDINFTNSNWGIPETIGRFYLFNNGKWIFVERGFKRTNQSTSWITYPFENYLQMDPVPAGIVNKLGNRTINTTVQVLIPATDPRFGNHYAGTDVNFVITRNGVTISGGNSIVPVGADTEYSNIFKIANKQGTL